MATALIPLSWNTSDELWATPTNTMDSNDGYQFGGLPPGWTLEGISYVVMLLRMRLGICYVGALTNIVVLLLQVKLQSYRKTQCLFGMMLTAADGTYIVAVLIESHIYYRNQEPPIILGALVLGSSLLAHLAIIAVGLDRYLALCVMPLKYKFVVTTRKYSLVVATMIVFAIIYSYIFNRYFTVDSTLVTVRIFTVLMVYTVGTSLTYIVIGTSLARLFKKTNLGETVKKARMQQTKRLMFAFSLILVTNIICHLPQSLFALWLTFQPIDQRYSVLQNIIIGNWLYNIRTINSFCNPIIYWTHVLMREISWPTICSKKTTERARTPSTADVSGASKTTSLSESVDAKGSANSSFRAV